MLHVLVRIELIKEKCVCSIKLTPTTSSSSTPTRSLQSPSTTNQANNSSSGVSGLAIGFFVFGAIVLIIILAVIAFLVYKKRNSKPSPFNPGASAATIVAVPPSNPPGGNYQYANQMYSAPSVAGSNAPAPAAAPYQYANQGYAGVAPAMGNNPAPPAHPYAAKLFAPEPVDASANPYGQNAVYAQYNQNTHYEPYRQGSQGPNPVQEQQYYYENAPVVDTNYVAPSPPAFEKVANETRYLANQPLQSNLQGSSTAPPGHGGAGQ
jgi:hypothetical protein